MSDSPNKPEKRGDSGSAAASKPKDDAPKPAAGDAPSFEIDWFDEGSDPGQGRLFATPKPEPPPQPHERIRDTGGPRAASSRPSKAGPSGARAADAGAHEEPARPPLWKRLIWGSMPMWLLLGGYTSVILTQDRIGYAWDEAYYYEPSMRAADWLTELLRGGRPTGREAIDEAWGTPGSEAVGGWEHPSVQKVLSGVSIRLFKNPKDHLYAMRLPMAILFGMSLALIYLLGRRAWGTWAGLASALIFATLPRVYGHAHFASLETPLIFMTLLVVFCYLRGLDSAFWSVCTGVSFGLLLATKINGFFLPIPLIVWSQLYARDRYANNLFAMLTLGPAAMVLAWPWLWPDPAGRLLAYLYFHAQHQQTALFFMGKAWGYGGVNAPWFYPLAMIGVSVPLVSLALIGLGVLKTCYRVQRRPYSALFLTIVIVLLGVACAPATPRYDGVRLFLQVFPFLALLGGSMMATLIEMLERAGRRRGFRGHPSRYGPARWARNVLLLLIAIDGGGACMRAHPYLLSYFNPLAGGVAGARDRGFEITYWGDALNHEAIETLNKLPDGSTVMPLALHALCLKHLQIWGELKEELKIGEGEPPYDYHLLQMRRGFFRYPEKALADGGRFRPVADWGPEGVPLLALYETGPAFEEYWTELKQTQAFGP